MMYRLTLITLLLINSSLIAGTFGGTLAKPDPKPSDFIYETLDINPDLMDYAPNTRQVAIRSYFGVEIKMPGKIQRTWQEGKYSYIECEFKEYFIKMPWGTKIRRHTGFKGTKDDPVLNEGPFKGEKATYRLWVDPQRFTQTKRSKYCFERVK